MSEKSPWKKISSRTVYDNDWITVKDQKVITPAGTVGVYGKVSFKNIAVGIIPIDDAKNIWLVGQHRYTLDEYSWEIPEGGCPAEEEPLDAAKRELKEETGLVAEKWKCIMRLHTSNSVTDEEAFIFTAENLTQEESQPEDTEDLKVQKLPLREAVEMIKRSEITDAISVAGILRVAMTE
jgi:8-oxo-dGTP pyrophosphatase MutT (NUDIX family)